MSDASSRSEYLVISRGQWDADASREQIQAAIDQFYAWHDQLVQQGRMRPGQRLAPERRWVSRSGITDGPFAEAKEVVGGYWHILAASLDEAAALAAGNPCLACGLSFEIRPIDPVRARASAITCETPQVVPGTGGAAPAALPYIPPGFNTVTPYCFVAGAEAFVRFLVEGLGGTETCRTLRGDGHIANAQVRIGGSTLMVSEATPHYPPMPASHYLYVADAPAAMARALAAGATQVMAVADMPYGDRQGGVRDAHGNLWWISQRLVREPYTD